MEQGIRGLPHLRGSGRERPDGPGRADRRRPGGRELRGAREEGPDPRGARGETRTCLCGCGEALVGRERIKKGHGKRLRNRKIPCACGCGTLIHEFLSNYYRCRFAHGHGTPQTAGRLMVNCLHCGTEFPARPWRRREGRDFYCSKQCMKDARRAGYRAFTCRVCGKEVVILRKLYGSRRGKFCSSKCAGLARRGKRFPWSFKPGAEHPRWTGGYVKYYGPNWRRQQRLARARDKVCQRCGAPPAPRRALDVHHRIPFKKFGLIRYEEANGLANLVCLCQKCHLELTKKSAKILRVLSVEVLEKVARLVGLADREPGQVGR